ncbi:hypothetical protein J3456_19375 [Sulfitobacter sp. NFXS29]|uniref:hypothetical protein n=1 Tax=Sulfitobacter sp. NFXS29 TaxID=2818438 RepID=UPI0032E03086
MMPRPKALPEHLSKAGWLAVAAQSRQYLLHMLRPLLFGPLLAVIAFGAHVVTKGAENAPSSE